MNKKIIELFKNIPVDKNEKIKYFLTLQPTEENLEFLVQYSFGKIQETLEEIEFRKLDVEPFVSLSGKDSIVMLDLVRKFEPNVKHMFSNTGLEWPSHVKFWKENYPDLEWVKSKDTQINAYKKQGAPIVSKNISAMLRDVMGGGQPKKEFPTTILKRLGGDFNPNYSHHKESQFKLSKKWLFLLDVDNFPNKYSYSSKCCDIFKGNVKHLKGKWAFVGTRLEESMNRASAWKRTGCINYGAYQTNPLSLWPYWATTMYVDKYDLKLPETYTKMKMKRTGCYSCPFPLIHQQKEGAHNLDLLYKHYPSVYKHTLDKVGLRLNYQYMDVRVEDDKEYMKELEVINRKKQVWYNNLEYNFAKQCVKYTHDKKDYVFDEYQIKYIAESYNLNAFDFNHWIKFWTNYYKG